MSVEKKLPLRGRKWRLSFCVSFVVSSLAWYFECIPVVLLFRYVDRFLPFSNAWLVFLCETHSPRNKRKKSINVNRILNLGLPPRNYWTEHCLLIVTCKAFFVESLKLFEGLTHWSCFLLRQDGQLIGWRNLINSSCLTTGKQTITTMCFG